jgi:Secretion system C-terminal sorting domain
MKKLFFTLFLFLIIINPLQAQTFLWVNNNTHNIQFNPDYAVFPSSADESGNFIIGSIFEYKITHGSLFMGDVILRKYNPLGLQLFSKVLTGTSEIEGVETDSQGNLYVYGFFLDTLHIDPSHIIINTGSGMFVNSFLIKLDNSGNFVWSKNITAIYGNFAYLNSLKAKDSSILGAVLANTQNFIMKFDLNGNELLSIPVSYLAAISGIDMNSRGEIFATGPCGDGNINFGGLIVNTTNKINKFFVKFSPAGSGVWARFVQDIAFETNHIVCDDEGNSYACGDLNGPYLFGNIQTLGPQWIFDFYLTKLDSSGMFLWVKEIPHSSGGPVGDAAVGQSTNISLDNSNNIYITGFQRGNINWGNFTTSSAGLKDIMVLKYNSSGNLIWGKTAGGLFDDRGDAISLDNAGNIFISGNFSQSASFDTIAVIGSGSINSFAAELTNAPVIGVLNQKNNAPESYSLTNYPNPFNPSTKIIFDIPSSGVQNTVPVKIVIYDILGKEVAKTVNHALKPGSHEVVWNAAGFPSGVYLYRLTAGDVTVTNKIMLVK